MSLTTEERSALQARCAEIVARDFIRGFQSAYTAAMNIMRARPRDVDREIFNADVDKCRADAAETLAKGLDHLVRAERHYKYAEYLCYMQMITFEFKHVRNYMGALESEYRSFLHHDTFRSWMDIQVKKENVKTISVGIRHELEHLEADCALIAKEITALKLLSADLGDFRVHLVKTYPLTADQISAYGRTLIPTALNINPCPFA